MYLNPYDNVFETLFTMWLNTFWPGNLTLFQIEYALINGTRPHFLFAPFQMSQNPFSRSTGVLEKATHLVAIGVSPDVIEFFLKNERAKQTRS